MTDPPQSRDRRYGGPAWRAPVSDDVKVCLACGLGLDYGIRCHAQTYGHMIDREGRHEGGCWGGRFPTTEGLREWEARLEQLREKHAEGRATEEALPTALLESEQMTLALD